MVLAFRFFYVIGPIFVVWALVISVLGIARRDFPGRLGGQRVIVGVSFALMLAVILSATIGAKFEHPEQTKTGPAAHGKRGNPAP